MLLPLASRVVARSHLAGVSSRTCRPTSCTTSNRRRKIEYLL
ncbi:hypothetical protein DFAR_1070002 [Desulfarculales bacterium]